LLAVVFRKFNVTSLRVGQWAVERLAVFHAAAQKLRPRGDTWKSAALLQEFSEFRVMPAQPVS